MSDNTPRWIDRTDLEPRDVIRRTADYAGLCARVREIDPKAADYMEGKAMHLDDFTPGPGLYGTFVWDKTPQGYGYWSNINSELHERGTQW